MSSISPFRLSLSFGYAYRCGCRVQPGGCSGHIDGVSPVASSTGKNALAVIDGVGAHSGFLPDIGMTATVTPAQLAVIRDKLAYARELLERWLAKIRSRLNALEAAEKTIREIEDELRPLLADHWRPEP